MECEEHEYDFSPYCGVDVCKVCGYHKNLAKCFCGWKMTLEDLVQGLEDDEQDTPLEFLYEYWEITE